MKDATRTVSVVLDAAGLARALSVPAFNLRVVKGPDKGKHRKIAASRVAVGSGEGSGFRVGDPTVSALHCEILADRRGFRVRDLGAKNGVVLAGRKVVEAWLSPSDDLVLGDSVVRFKLEGTAEEVTLGAAAGFGRLRGGSLAMRELYAVLARAARSDAAVLLIGETGTGKELAADAIVSEGARRDRPLVVVDCGRLDAQLAESELFGHEKGAFTGADRRVAGAFERAQGGTVLLDEIGELPLSLQPKLLGVLERKVVQPLGGGAPVPIDVRVIAATHRDLPREVNRGTFRADLYYRLSAIEVSLPPLRSRAEDIPELVEHFLAELPGARRRLSAASLARLCAGDWPGNVRELRNAVEREALGIGHAVDQARAKSVDLDTPYRVQKEQRLAEFDRAYFTALLEACKGNVSEAARRSGLNRVHLHGVLARLGL